MKDEIGISLKEGKLTIVGDMEACKELASIFNAVVRGDGVFKGALHRFEGKSQHVTVEFKLVN